MKPPKSKFRIMVVLTGHFDGFPLILRVRQLLKYCGRVLGLRCESIDWQAPESFARIRAREDRER